MQLVDPGERKMIKVRSYSDYRFYLKDYIDFRAQKQRGFSVRQFCFKVGINTDNYVLRIIRGERNLTPAMGEKFIPALGLKGADAEYFRALIGAERARTETERLYYQRITDRLAVQDTAPRRIDNTMLRNWFLMVIWELASCRQALMTIDDIVRCLGGKVNRAQASEALRFLVEHGYLEQEEGGKFRKRMVPAYSTDGVADPFVRMNHVQMLEAAQQSLQLPVAERAFYGLVVAGEAKRMAEIQARLLQFLESLRDEINTHANPDCVYRVGAHAFPLASTTEDRRC